VTKVAGLSDKPMAIPNRAVNEIHIVVPLMGERVFDTKPVARARLGPSSSGTS